MKRILFVNFGHYTDTPVEVPNDVYLRRINCRIPLKDPSHGLEVQEKAIEAVQSVRDEILAAQEQGDEIIIALPGASMISTVVVVLLGQLLARMPKVITGTKTRSGYVFKLDRVVDLLDVELPGGWTLTFE